MNDDSTFSANSIENRRKIDNIIYNRKLARRRMLIFS